MSDFEYFLSRVHAYLASRGWRRTRQRELLAYLIYNIESSFTADELVRRTKDLGTETRISRPTIYRTLDEFVAAGVIQRRIMETEPTEYHRLG